MMVSVESLLEAISSRTIAKRVFIRHDEARATYPMSKNVVRDFRELEQVIGDYYSYHHASCFSGGHRLPASEAESRAKGIVEREYRSHAQPMTMAFNDAYEGLNGGVRGILDRIADALKREATENYVRSTMDRHLSPVDWEPKVELIRQLIRAQPQVLRDYQGRAPEEFATNYEPLVRSVAEALGGVENAMRGVGRAP